MAQVCLDASLVLDLFLPSDIGELVEEQWRRWLNDGTELIAPYFFQIETTSVIRNKIFLGRISQERGEFAFRALRRLTIRFIDFPDLQEQAWTLAYQLNRSEAYDAQYLVVAQHTGCELWTTDRHLFNSVHERLPWVRSIQR